MDPPSVDAHQDAGSIMECDTEDLREKLLCPHAPEVSINEVGEIEEEWYTPWEPFPGINGPSMNNLLVVNAAERTFVVASQNKLLAFRDSEKTSECVLPARINNMCLGRGPYDATIVVVLENGQTSILTVKPLKIVRTWNNGASTWGVSMSSDMVVCSSNDYKARAFALGHETTSCRMQFSGHRGNLPCVYAWGQNVLSAGLDGMLALWDCTDPRPTTTRSELPALWGCTRIAKRDLVMLHGVYGQRASTARQRDPDLGDIPSDIARVSLLQFLAEDDLLTLAMVKSQWVHLAAHELGRPDRSESVFVAVTEYSIILLDEGLNVIQTSSADDDAPPHSMAFATLSEPLGNRIFIARMHGSVVLVSLYRLFNSVKIGMRVNAIPHFPPSFGLCVSRDSLFGLTDTGCLWRASI